MHYHTAYYDTLAEAQAAQRAYIERYPPEGYCTNTSVVEYEGRWVLTASRFSSCD